MEKNKIYKKDAIKFLKGVAERSVDLAIIDPPYNMSKADWDTFKSQDDFLKFTYKWLDALIPTLKDTGSLYVFNTPYNSAYILQYLVEKGLVFQNWITWDKRDGFNASTKRYTHGQETILFFTKSKKYTFNADDDVHLFRDGKELTKGIIAKECFSYDNGDWEYTDINGEVHLIKSPKDIKPEPATTEYKARVKTKDDEVIEDLTHTLISAQEYFNVDLMPEIMAIANKISKRKDK